MRPVLVRLSVCGWLLIGAVACSPKIGRHCGNSLDCSAQGTRLCDRTQPNGYCTIMGCEEGTCPSEAVCVKFRASEERLAKTYCMATCTDADDCRESDGYRCTLAKDFGQRDDAKILGNPTQKFCSIPALMPTVTPATKPAHTPDDGGRGDAAGH
jgi:hypothetical protein